ncbi:unnamed protein product [Paramecium sonneborni]|uniref:Transmembrane protein n=1 Tax=Paramecium sonneborni TaxID=65129 RepID=A0A8S1RI43_9CILI|nr:unnamed protein product [Paramecium sonneborni]
MINKYILLFITIIVGYQDDIYGNLELNEMRNFTVDLSMNTWISFLSFQGPIKFARVSEDGKLIELQPLPGTYFFYDYMNEDFESTKPVTYSAYGSKGGATYPQFRFSKQYGQMEYKTPSLMTYNNSDIKYKSQDGYLILDIPMIIQRDGQFIKRLNFIINVGHQKDKEMLKLNSQVYYEQERSIDCMQSNYNEMTFSNYYTTVYIKINPSNNYDYFAIICYEYNLPLGGSTFSVQYSDSDSNIWIWIIITLILLILLILVGCYINKQKRKKEEHEDVSNFHSQLN